MGCLPWHPWTLRVPQLEEMQPFVIFLQDFAPALSVYTSLDEPDRWTVCGGTTPCPPPLSNKPLDFCLCVKNSVCRTYVDDIANLRTSIIDAIRSAAKKMLIHRGTELAFRRDVSSATRVSHAEVDKNSHEPLWVKEQFTVLQFISVLVTTQHIFKIRTSIC
jgi:hypothetical protein